MYMIWERFQKLNCQKNNKFSDLKNKILKCNHCERNFGFKPNPVFWGKENSKIVQISQAPSKSVNESLKPFTDLSGKELRNVWYKISEEDFYNTDNFYIVALAHCYPGKDKNGNDKIPPKCCYEMWIKKEIELVDNKIYIIIGAKAAKVFFPAEKFEELVFKNNVLNNKLAIVLPHPSPLNRLWLKKHPDFLESRMIEVRKIIKNTINDK